MRDKLYAQISTFGTAITTACPAMHLDSDLAQLRSYLQQPCTSASQLSALVGLSHVLCMRARVCANLPANSLVAVYNDLADAASELAQFLKVRSERSGGRRVCEANALIILPFAGAPGCAPHARQLPATVPRGHARDLRPHGSQPLSCSASSGTKHGQLEPFAG
jgi:hypothetical protein